MAVLETRGEWACIEHWIENAYKPDNQKFAISLRADYGHPGHYLWIWPDLSTTVPEYEVWATAHPQDGPCVSMMIGDGVDHAGQWLDGECHGDTMWGICELQP